MTKLKLPRYLRFGVRTHKSLEQVRREALEAERFERRRIWKKRLGWVSFLVPDRRSSLRFLYTTLLVICTPAAAVVGFFAGIFLGPVMGPYILWEELWKKRRKIT